MYCITDIIIMYYKSLFIYFYINIQNIIIVCAYKFYSIIGGRKFERQAITTQTSDAFEEMLIGTGRSKKCQFLSLS